MMKTSKSRYIKVCSKYIGSRVYFTPFRSTCICCKYWYEILHRDKLCALIRSDQQNEVLYSSTYVYKIRKEKNLPLQIYRRSPEPLQFEYKNVLWSFGCVVHLVLLKNCHPGNHEPANNCNLLRNWYIAHRKICSEIPQRWPHELIPNKYCNKNRSRL